MSINLLKIGALIRFYGSNAEWIINNIDFDKRKVWATQKGTLLKLCKPVIRITHFNRNPVTIIK